MDELAPVMSMKVKCDSKLYLNKLYINKNAGAEFYVNESYCKKRFPEQVNLL